MLNFLQMFTKSRSSWILLMLTGFALEGCGLYFQYQLHLDPCVNCVYERAYILGFIVAGFIGFINPVSVLVRLAGALLLLAASVGGLIVATEHYLATSSDSLGATCKLRASYPSFLPLDDWLPWMFAPKGTCTPLDWQFLTLSMPEWIVIIFLCGVLAALTIILCAFIRQRHDYLYLYK